MTKTSIRQHPEQQVDLLVDGELSEADRRELLLQLEHEPDGWRRCALAFLEAQCWKAELGQIARAGGEGRRGDRIRGFAAGANGRRQSWRQYAATMLTIAASFLMALVVGMGLRGNWSGGSSHSPDSSGEDGDCRILLPEPTAVASDSGHDWEMVTLTRTSRRTARLRPFRVPAQRRDTLDQGMLEQYSRCHSARSCSRPSSSRAIASCSSVKSFPSR